MKRNARSAAALGVLVMGGLVGIGIPSVRAQDYANPPRPYYVPAPAYYAPAPAYYAPAPSSNSDPAQRLAPPAWGLASPAPAGGNYSYYDADGVERDPRYPHWRYDPSWYLPR